VLPLSTAYSVSEALGRESALDDSFHDAPIFYCTYGAVVGVSVLLVLIPGAPLVPILFLTQALNAILLVPLLILLACMSRDPMVMGDRRSSRAGGVAPAVTIGMLGVSVGALLLLTLVPV